MNSNITYIIKDGVTPSIIHYRVGICFQNSPLSSIVDILNAEERSVSRYTIPGLSLSVLNEGDGKCVANAIFYL